MTSSSPENSGILSESDLNTLYQKTTGEEATFDSTSYLRLDPENKKHQKFLKNLKMRLPNCSGICIESIPKNMKILKVLLNFMFNYFPQQVNDFTLNFYSDLSGIEDFMPALSEISQRVTRKFYLHNFEISKGELQIIVQNFSKVDTLCFSNCKIDLSSVPKFDPLWTYKIRTLNLFRWGDDFRGRWAGDLQGFKNLVKGIGESKVREKLEKVFILWWGVKEGEEVEVMRENGMGDVQVVGAK